MNPSFAFVLLGVGHIVGLSVGVAMLVGLSIAWVARSRSSARRTSRRADRRRVREAFHAQVRFIGAGAIAVAACGPCSSCRRSGAA